MLDNLYEIVPPANFENKYQLHISQILLIVVDSIFLPNKKYKIKHFKDTELRDLRRQLRELHHIQQAYNNLKSELEQQRQEMGRQQREHARAIEEVGKFQRFYSFENRINLKL